MKETGRRRASFSSEIGGVDLCLLLSLLSLGEKWLLSTSPSGLDQTHDRQRKGPPPEESEV